MKENKFLYYVRTVPSQMSSLVFHEEILNSAQVTSSIMDSVFGPEAIGLEVILNIFEGNLSL